MEKYTLESLGFKVVKETPATNEEFDAITGVPNSAAQIAVAGWMGTTFSSRLRNKLIERIAAETEVKRDDGQSQASYIESLAKSYAEEDRDFYEEFAEIAQEVADDVAADFKAQRGGGDGGTRAPTKKAVELFESALVAGRIETLAEQEAIELVEFPETTNYDDWTDEQLECRNRLANAVYARYKARIAELETESLI